MHARPNFMPNPPGATALASQWVELNWDVAALGPIGRRYREGPWPRFRDRVPGVGWRYRPAYRHPKLLLCPPWVVDPEVDGGS